MRKWDKEMYKNLVKIYYKMQQLFHYKLVYWTLIKNTLVRVSL